MRTVKFFVVVVVVVVCVAAEDLSCGLEAILARVGMK